MRVCGHLSLDEVAGVVQVDAVGRILLRFYQHGHFLSVAGAAKLTQLVGRILLDRQLHNFWASEIANCLVHAVRLDHAGGAEAPRRRLPARLNSKAIPGGVEKQVRPLGRGLLHRLLLW